MRRLAASLRALAVALALGLAGCASFDVRTDRDPSFDFAGARTWQWARDAGGNATPDARLASDALHHAVRRALADELASHGLREVESGGDLALDYRLGIERTLEVEAEPLHQPAGLAGSVYVGVPRVERREVEHGAIAVELADPAGARAAWSATVRARLHEAESTPEARDARLRAAVRALFAELPRGE